MIEGLSFPTSVCKAIVQQVVLVLGYIDGWVRSVWIIMKKGDPGRTRDETLEAEKNKL